MALPLRAELFDIRNFGGRGDGVTDNTKAFHAAMVAAGAVAGGVELVVPSGIWLTAPFNLTSHLTLNITRGATLLASDDPAVWPVIAPLPSYGQGRDHPGPRFTSFLHGVRVSDLVVTGGGTIDGQGQAWWARHRNGSETLTRGRLFEVEWSDGVLIEDLVLTNSPYWTLHPVFSSNIVARRLNISNPTHSPNTDGFDPDSCENATFVDSVYVGGDDGVAIKSGWDCFGIGQGVPSRNIYLRNLTIRSPHAAGICIGSEMSGGVEDVIARDIVLHDVGQGLRIKAAKGRGGYVRRVTYSNVTISSFEEHAIQINDFYGAANPTCKGKDAGAVPRISDVAFHDVRAVSSRGSRSSAANFVGLESSPILNVTLRNVSLPRTSPTGAPVWECHQVEGRSQGVSPPVCPQLHAPLGSEQR